MQENQGASGPSSGTEERKQSTACNESSLCSTDGPSRSMVFKSKFVILCCALGGHAVNLIPFSYGMFLPYVYSYIYEFDNSISMSMMHVHAPLCLTVATGTAWTFGVFQKYISQRILHILNGLFMLVWMLVMFFFGNNYIVITFAIAFTGFHAGQLHVFFSQRVTEEGRRYPSTANGFYGFLFGLAGVWGPIMSSLYINPWCVSPVEISSNSSKAGSSYIFMDERVLARVPHNWLLIVIVMAVLFFPGFFVIAKTESDEELSTLLEKEDPKGAANAVKEVVENEQSIFSMTGFALFLTTIGIGTSSMCAFDLFKDFGLKAIDDDGFLNLAGMLIPIVGAVGRIIWGTLGDKMSLRTLFVSGNGLSVILQGLMYPCRRNKYSYVIVTAVLSVMPGMMTLLPPSVKKFMGTSNIALKYGVILTGEVVGCMYYLILSSFLWEQLGDLALVLLLGIPATLAIIPTLIYIRDNHSTQTGNLNAD